jgi:hypothetical protein
LLLKTLYLVSEAKSGLSALALKRHLGVSYPAARLLHPKLMQAMSEREALTTLRGTVQVDEAYLGGERTGGKAGRGSENKIPFVAAVSMDDQNHPAFVKFSPVPGFTLKAIAAWAKDNLSLGRSVISEGLDCFRALTQAACPHQALVVGGKSLKSGPKSTGSIRCWVISRRAWRVLIMPLPLTNTGGAFGRTPCHNAF